MMTDLTFVAHQATGVVHVAVPPAPAQLLAVDATPLLCRLVAVRGAEPVESFDGAALCSSCYRTWTHRGGDPDVLYRNRVPA
jgi:hypothetical protein